MNRADFVERWRQKALESADPFDRFFSAWIALVIAARPRLDECDLSQPDTDRKAVMRHLEANATAIVHALRTVADDTAWLAARKGTATHAAIVDVYPASPPHLRRLFDALANVWGGTETRKPKWVAQALAELINHIRNHMFHGLKNPDDAADQALVEHLNPILLQLLPGLVRL